MTQTKEPMMNNVQEYQLPWRIDGDYIVNAEGLAVCEWTNPGFGPEVQQEHAERIVAAVNATSDIATRELDSGLVRQAFAILQEVLSYIGVESKGLVQSGILDVLSRAGLLDAPGKDVDTVIDKVIRAHEELGQLLGEIR